MADLGHLSTPGIMQLELLVSAGKGLRTHYIKRKLQQERVRLQDLSGVKKAELTGAEAQAEGAAVEKGCQNLMEETGRAVYNCLGLGFNLKMVRTV